MSLFTLLWTYWNHLQRLTCFLLSFMVISIRKVVWLNYLKCASLKIHGDPTILKYLGLSTYFAGWIGSCCLGTRNWPLLINSFIYNRFFFSELSKKQEQICLVMLISLSPRAAMEDTNLQWELLPNLRYSRKLTEINPQWISSNLSCLKLEYPFKREQLMGSFICLQAILNYHW